MSGIAIITATRGRPVGLDRFIESMVLNSNNQDNVRFYLYIDEDDFETIEHIKNIKYANNIKAIIGPRIKLPEAQNVLASVATEDIFFLGADDLVMRTKGWDDLIISFFDASPDKIWLVYGEDGGNQAIATHPIIHRKWVETLGYLMPTYFESDYTDTWLDDIASRLNRKIKLPMFNEHMHFTFGKAPMDKTYYENRIRCMNTNPGGKFHDSLNVRLLEVDKLKCKMIL